jgi:hypothetical protein
MEVIKYIERKVKKDSFFFETKLDISKDKNYFISKIEDGIKLENNKNYMTNVKGKMTDWNYFVKDQIFINYLVEGCNKIKKFLTLNEVLLMDAWGIKITKKDYTASHDHATNHYSGILYLNDSNTLTFFPDLKLDIKPKEGTFILFSSILIHSTEEHLENIPKYAIPFNLNKNSGW